MESSNPYSAPKSQLDLETTESSILHEPRSLSLGRGIAWFAHGFDYFKRNPGAWILTTILSLTIFIVVSILPIVNFLGSTLHYLFAGGLMIGLKAQNEGDDFELAYLFAGFRRHFVPLLLLSLMSLLISILVVIATFSLFGAIYLSGSTSVDAFFASITTHPQLLLLLILVVLALLVPLFMAMWFAPALIVLHDVGVLKAMKLSFSGCAKNMLPFLLYGFFGLLLMIFALLPLFLGLLVFIPIFTASIFASYREIFLQPNID